jgi:hypothetical protein
MKPFKTLGSLVLLSSSLFLATSCTKSLDEMSKDGQDASKLSRVPPPVANCSPFLGIQTRQNSPNETFAFLGQFNATIERQAFYQSDFTANNLLQFSATGGSPYYDPQFIRIGVNDQWIEGTEVLSLKIQNGKAAKRMQMQYRTLNTGVSAMASFFLAGVPVGSIPVNVAPGPISGILVYEAVGDVKEFDEVQFSVTNGKFAISGFTPNASGGGVSGFNLVETAGNRVVLRLASGTTNIGGTDYPNQFFTVTTNFVGGAAAMRQNRNPLANLAPGSGEFTNSGSPVIPGSKNYVNIWGNGPLVFRNDVNNFRFGVNDQFINGEEIIYITPGVDFPGTKFRMVEVRSATLQGSKLWIRAYNNGTLVAERLTSGADKSFTLLTSNVEFNEVQISAPLGSSEASLGRITPGPVGGAILLYPSCQ